MIAPRTAAGFPRINVALWLVVGLLVVGIVGSLFASALAFSHADPTFPEKYHWEGAALDRDFAEATRARELQIRAQLQVLADSQQCRLALATQGAQPADLTLSFVHGTRSDLDRQLRLPRHGEVYETHCAPFPDAHWHLELTDGARTWIVRRELTGEVRQVELSAQGP